MSAGAGDYIVLIGIAAIVLPMGSVLGYFFYVNNSSDTKEMRAVLFESKHYDIRNIDLMFTSGRPKGRAEAEITTITHADDIQEVLSAMAARVEQNPPPAPKQWMGMLTVASKTRTVQVEVVRYHGHATMLLLKTNGHNGWNLGTYACPKLGPVLDRLAGITPEPGEDALPPESTPPQ